MNVLLLLTFFVDMIYLCGSNREPFYFFQKNYSAYSSDFYTYSYHHGQDGHQHNPVPYNPDTPSPKHERSYSYQNEKRNAEPRQQSRQTHEDYSNFEDGSSDFVYPSDRRDVKQPYTENIAGRNCTYSLCQEVDDYPGEYIKNLFDRTRIYDAFFNATPPPTLDNRFALTDFDNLCLSTSSITYPRSAINKNKIKRFIPNYEEYRQGVRVESCTKTDKPCQLTDSLPFGYETKCEQRFTTVVLLALDDDKNPVIDTFLSPSCCVCTFKSRDKN